MQRVCFEDRKLTSRDWKTATPRLLKSAFTSNFSTRDGAVTSERPEVRKKQDGYDAADRSARRMSVARS